MNTVSFSPLNVTGVDHETRNLKHKAVRLSSSTGTEQAPGVLVGFNSLLVPANK